VTSPVVGFTVANEVFTLDHVPPGVALDNVVVDPWQRVLAPVIAAGRGFTVTICVALTVPQLLLRA